MINEEKFDEFFKIIKLHPDCVQHFSHVLVDEAQESGSRETALLHGSKTDRIMRELDHLQPLKAKANLTPADPAKDRQGTIRRHKS